LEPTYQALEELGRTVRTVFAGDYLVTPELRREMHGGLPVAENWNSANTVIFYNKDGDLTGRDREQAEVSMLACCSRRWCTSTLQVQAVLKVPEFHDLIGEESAARSRPCSDRTSTPTGDPAGHDTRLDLSCKRPRGATPGVSAVAKGYYPRPKRGSPNGQRPNWQPSAPAKTGSADSESKPVITDSYGWAPESVVEVDFFAVGLAAV
jgi:Tn3 transposase DDE domain